MAGTDVPLAVQNMFLLKGSFLSDLHISTFYQSFHRKSGKILGLENDSYFSKMDEDRSVPGATNLRHRKTSACKGCTAKHMESSPLMQLIKYIFL